MHKRDVSVSLIGSAQEGGRQRHPLIFSPEDRIVGEREREAITGYSRGWWWRLEQRGEVPKRIKLGARKVGWVYRDLIEWRRQRASLQDQAGDQ